MKIQYLGQIRALIGRHEELVTIVPGITVLAILRTLAKKYGDEFKAEVLDDSKRALREGILITVNGIALGQLEGLDTSLRNHDVIAILPLFTGGG